MAGPVNLYVVIEKNDGGFFRVKDIEVLDPTGASTFKMLKVVNNYRRRNLSADRISQWRKFGMVVVGD